MHDSNTEIVFRHPLEEPLQTETGEIKELCFRKPTAADLVRIGNPINLDPFAETHRIKFDEVKMNAMIAALTLVSPPFLAKMSPKDWMGCAWGIAPFFVPA